MRKIYALFFLLFPFLASMAQNNTIASGGDASGPGGSSSYSIGQAFYQRSRNEAFSVSEGLQQPIEIIVLDNTTFETNPQIRIYPNPVYSGFYITLPKADYDNSAYTLTDLNGKNIRQGNISSEDTFVDISGLASGIYMLKVQSSGKTNGYKIIKQ